MNFAIYGGQGPSTGTGLVVLLIDENNGWFSIRVTYLASARSDFFLGSFSADTYFAQTTSPNGVILYQYTLPNWTSSQRSYTIIAEISGIRTAALSLTAALTNIIFDPVSGRITSQLSLTSSPAI